VLFLTSASLAFVLFLRDAVAGARGLEIRPSLLRSKAASSSVFCRDPSSTSVDDTQFPFRANLPGHSASGPVILKIFLSANWEIHEEPVGHAQCNLFDPPTPRKVDFPLGMGFVLSSQGRFPFSFHPFSLFRFSDVWNTFRTASRGEVPRPPPLQHFFFYLKWDW